MKNFISLKVLSIIIAAIGLISCSSFNKKMGISDDNIVEEITERIVEDIIKQETGIDFPFDLTPESPEKNV